MTVIRSEVTQMNETKFFCLPNLTTNEVTVLEDPWNVKVPEEVLALPKDKYKARWRNPETKHWLLLMAEGQCSSAVVSVGNEAAALYGFMADYDGVLTDDMVDALLKKPQGRYSPRYWCRSHSDKLHLFWFFERPIAVTGNVHASELLRYISRKIKAVNWGVGYDPSCENVTQVLDIGKEWHVFRENAAIPYEELVLWDSEVFRKIGSKQFVQNIVDIPLDKVIEEINRRQWPHQPPGDLREGLRCLRFWDPGADNNTAAQMTKDGFRVYTPHDGGFKSWTSLLGPEFCEEYTAKSLAPFLANTYYYPAKDEFWRFFDKSTPQHFEKRTEKVLRRDIKRETGISDKPAKGAELSEVDKLLYDITNKNWVDAVAPVIYRRGGRCNVRGLGTILNTSLVTVRRPAERVNIVTPETVAAEQCPQQYKDNPLLCRWDNPFAVAKFPHIHRLFTTFFMKTQQAYDNWADAEYPLYNPDGSPVRQLRDRQLLLLISWLAHFYRNAGRMCENPGRGLILFLAGPAGVGKSFIGRQILGELMGGATDAEKFYLEGGRFNSGIVTSPVHLIDDKLGSRSHRTHLQFTEALKIVAANAVLRYEAKFGSAVESVPWAGRIVVLANEDRQSLSVLPSLDMATRDKFLMLKAGGAKFRWGTDNENQHWLAEELPYFGRFLLGWDIPVEIRDDRFGVRAWQQDDMVQASAENGLSQTVLQVLEECIEETTGATDPKERGDMNGWAIEGNAVKIFKWIQSVDPALGREVIDSKTLHINMQPLCNNGYGITYDERTKRYRIPYSLGIKSTDTP